jgi:hypothetical protein
MLNNFITVLIVEITKFLSKNKQFLEQDSKKRLSTLEEFKLPNSIKDYLSEVKSGDLTSDLSSLIEFLKGSTASISENKLAVSIAKFLNKNFANDVYSLPLDFFKITYAEQTEAANKVINSNSELATALKGILTDYSYQEILNEIQNFSSKTLNTPLIIVQSPIELSFEQKTEIKDQLNKEQKAICVPLFTINKSLIGGLRIYLNGKVQDFSWLGKINLITSLKI